MPNYTIEARSLSVAGIAGHDFWVLRDEHGNAVAEMHGLATNRETGRPVPIGTDPDKFSLRAWHYPHDQAYADSLGVPRNDASYIRDGQPARTVLSADREEVMARWNSAVGAMRELNALDLDYPRLGVSLFGRTVNSNSAYRTFGEIMGVQVDDFPGRIEPGIRNRMLPPERIEQLRTHGYPVLDEPRIDPPSPRADTRPSERDQAYFDELRDRLPAGVSDRTVLDSVYRARQADIPLESFSDIAYVGERAFVVGKTPGFRAELDLSGNAPAAENTATRLASLDAVPENIRERGGPTIA